MTNNTKLTQEQLEAIRKESELRSYAFEGGELIRRLLDEHAALTAVACMDVRKLKEQLRVQGQQLAEISELSQRLQDTLDQGYFES